MKFGNQIAANLRRSRTRPNDCWHLDEMVIFVRGERYLLWRAVDIEGEVLDFLVQKRRDARAAKRLMRNHGEAVTASAKNLSYEESLRECVELRMSASD